jgi:hypothetical protein
MKSGRVEESSWWLTAARDEVNKEQGTYFMTITLCMIGMRLARCEHYYAFNRDGTAHNRAAPELLHHLQSSSGGAPKPGNHSTARKQTIKTLRPMTLLSKAITAFGGLLLAHA